MDCGKVAPLNIGRRSLRQLPINNLKQGNIYYARDVQADSFQLAHVQGGTPLELGSLGRGSFEYVQRDLFSLRVGASLVGFSAAGTGRHQFEKQQADLVVTNSGGRLFELSLDSLRQRNRVLELSGAPQPGDRWTVSLDGETDYTWGHTVVGSGDTPRYDCDGTG